MIKNTQIKEMFKKLNENLLNISSIEEGMLGGIKVKYWIKCNKKDYLFKMNAESISDYSDFGEVFTSYLSFVLGYKCVKSVFSKDLFNDENDETRGVLVESYRTKNVKESFTLRKLIQKYDRRHFSGHTVNEILEICKEFCEDNNLCLDKNMEQELKDMALMDYLLIQTDRHSGNIEFLVEQKGSKKVLKLAPMFDNGYCLYLQNSPAEATKNLNLLTENKIEMGLKLSNPKPMFYIEESENIFDDDNCVVRDLATELLRNKKLMNLYQDFLKLDFEKEVDFICSIYKKNLPENNYNLILKGVENRIYFLNLELLRQSMLNKNEEQLF